MRRNRFAVSEFSFASTSLTCANALNNRSIPYFGASVFTVPIVIYRSSRSSGMGLNNSVSTPKGVTGIS